ncbi:MAG: hypothetical protein AAGN35_16875 [Bacteroidota bacterium]
MNFLLRTLAVTVALAFALTSCQPENVKPVNASNNEAPTLAGADTDPHPLPDPVCSRFDTVHLATAAGGLNVDYCGSFNNTPLPCPPVTPPWGFIEMLNGDDLMLMNFTLATGWFADLSRSFIGLTSNFQLDQNGVPIVSNDWLSIDIDPVLNRWQLTYQLSDLPSPCFDMAFRLTVVKLNFFSGIDADSEVDLYGYNTRWNDMNAPEMNSISPFITPWCPVICGPDPDDCTAEYLTFSQCQYGVCGTDGPAAQYLQANFDDAYPSGLTIGCVNGYVANFTSASAIEAFLPTQGTDLITQNLSDPLGRVSNRATFDFCSDWNAADACGFVDFDTDAPAGQGGAATQKGQFITTLYRDDIGMTISGESDHNNRTGDVIIFNSAQPSGGDWDLGTPNQAYGGPGIGSGGTNPMGINNVPEGNIIILAENVRDNNNDGFVDNPDDDAAGGTITFDFDDPITLNQLLLVDLDDHANNKIRFYYSDNRPMYEISCPQIGNNSRKSIDLMEMDNTPPDNVIKMEVTFSGSGAIGGIGYCRQNPYNSNACVANNGTGISSTLAGRIVAAMLTTTFDDFDPNFSASVYPFGDMVVASGPFQGLTVIEVIREANRVLGGCASQYTAQQLSMALEQINGSFIGGTQQNNFLICPGSN